MRCSDILTILRFRGTFVGIPLPRNLISHMWWLIALLILLAMFLIGVGVTSGII